MRRLGTFVFAVLLCSSALQSNRNAPRAQSRTGPIKTTVCEILEDPSSFNNKLVQVRGYLSVSFEDSSLHSESCSGGIWFAFADGSGPTGLAMIVNGQGTAGENDSDGHRTPPIPVKLVRDADFQKSENYLKASTSLNPFHPCGPDCHRYRVTATFTGRIDAVSEEVHAAHMKRAPLEPTDRRGFGHMGLYDAELVIGSVKEVEAVDLAHPHKAEPKSP